MPAVATPTTSPTTLDNPAGGAFALIFTRMPALLRLTCGLVGAVVALSVRTPPVEPAAAVPGRRGADRLVALVRVRALRHGISRRPGGRRRGR